MHENRYSVLMSVYYKEKVNFLKTSIDSMLQQTYEPDEITVVKDGELTSELNFLIQQYVEDYPSTFTIVDLPINVGLAKALDIGLDNCKNELIARMDSDDISIHTRCEAQLKAFNNNPNLCIVGTNINEFYEDPNYVVSSRVVPSNHESIKKFIKRRSPFNHPTVMFKKSEVKKCGGYGDLRRKQDLDLFSRMINNGCEASNIDESLVLFRSNSDSFQRRKSWDNVKSYIKVEYIIWRRGHCSFKDLVIVTLGQLLIFLSPIWLLKKISKKFLRKNIN